MLARPYERTNERTNGRQVESRGKGKVIVKDYSNAQYYGQVRVFVWDQMSEVNGW